MASREIRRLERPGRVGSYASAAEGSRRLAVVGGGHGDIVLEE
jgi:hypothetical protein